MAAQAATLSRQVLLKFMKFQLLAAGRTRYGAHFSTAAAVKFSPSKDLSVPKKPKDSKSFLANMFLGRVRTEQIFPYPDVLTAEQRETLQMITPAFEKFFANYDAAKCEDDLVVPEETMATLKEIGAFGLQVPPEFNGVGCTNSQFAALVQIVGRFDLSLGIILGAHQSIGFKGILLFGTPEQKKKYLPKLATGELLAAFALTEPGSGSDAGSIKTRAELSPDGKHWILNGSKIWISNGGFADVFTVFAKTPVKDAKTGGTKDAITAFIVERAFGGVDNSAPEKKMGIKCSNTAEVYFENTKVPVDNVVGEIGNGFKVAMNILNSGRFGMGAALSGSMRTSIGKAAEFARNRKQFGQTIDNFGAIQEKLARMAIQHYAAESVAYVVAGIMDLGFTDFQLEAATSKIFASESAWGVTDEAIQVMGGMGYMKATGLEKILRDLRIYRIFEGTNDILRIFIVLQGIQYAGSHLRELQKAMKNPVGNMGTVFKEACKRVTKSDGGASNALKSCVHPELASEAQMTAKCVTEFGHTIEQVLRKYGKTIVNEQFVLNRIAEAAIDTFSMAVVLSRATRAIQRKDASAAHEILMTKSWCAEASNRVQLNLRKTSGEGNLKLYKQFTEISRNVCNENGVVQENPLKV